MDISDKLANRIDTLSKEELLNQLSVYHEELLFQNQELREANVELSRLKEQYRNLFMDSPIAYAILDENHEVIKANGAFYQLLGLSRQLGITQYLATKSLSHCICPKSQDQYYHLFRKASQVTHTVSALLTMNGASDEMVLYVKTYVSKTEEFNGTYRVMLVDMTFEIEQQNQIEYMSYHDALTGLYNRSFFETELQRLGVKRQFPIGIIMGDVNGLKLINDAFGHHQGDILIINTAKAIQATCREEDLVARIGGDEFAILLLQTTEDKVKNLVNRLIQATRFMGIGDITLSTSFGYSLWEDRSQSSNDILRTTEDRMYKHKLIEQTSYRRTMIDGIVATLHEKHPREEQHSERVSEYVKKMARALALNEHTTSMLLTCARLHDIGKIALDYAILDKTEPLNDYEFKEIRKHPETGFRILMYSMGLSDIADIVLAHHEKIDGTGYPRGLTGEKIPLEAKILAICDAFDAMISDRPYRKAMSKEEAKAQLLKGAGVQFDPYLVEVFIEHCIDGL